MGGGGSSQQPYDALGGQYADFSYTPPSSSIDWQGIGSGINQGFQSYAKGVASGGSSPQMGQTPDLLNTPIQGSTVPFQLIPQSGGQNEILQLLQRLGLS